MKKLLLGLTLLTSMSAFSNTDCIDSINKAKDINQEYVEYREQRHGQARQQQQQMQQMQDDSFPSVLEIVDGFKEVYYSIRELMTESSRLEAAKVNVEYFTLLAKIEAGEYTKSEAKRTLGYKRATKLIQFQEAGKSVCITPETLNQKLTSMNKKFELVVAQYNTGNKSPEHFRTYQSYLYNATSAFRDVVQRPIKILSSMWAEENFVDADSADMNINPLRVRTKMELRRAINKK